MVLAVKDLVEEEKQRQGEGLKMNSMQTDGLTHLFCTAVLLLPTRTGCGLAAQVVEGPPAAQATPIDPQRPKQPGWRGGERALAWIPKANSTCVEIISVYIAPTENKISRSMHMQMSEVGHP